ncbi:hypothetical protein LOAG_13404 [Loa loa]|uniref:Uncharacterized protein n=1 Tax=Loa loa TaxID=7209 RepID=A0A1S0TJI9_LOALO|nr:hypothetical protein LOAG_13404 [Loa loa]EFO15110.1 hypothetical protein LOAG_13404 [Loa loa]
MTIFWCGFFHLTSVAVLEVHFTNRSRNSLFRGYFKKTIFSIIGQPVRHIFIEPFAFLICSKTTENDNELLQPEFHYVFYNQFPDHYFAHPEQYFAYIASSLLPFSYKFIKGLDESEATPILFHCSIN